MEIPTPKYKVEDKVLYMAEIDGTKTQVVAMVKYHTFSAPHWAWSYRIVYRTTFGWANETVLEMYLAPLREKPVASIDVPLMEFAREIAANNPGFNCKIDKCHEFSWNTAVIFECDKTVPPLCKKTIIPLDDLQSCDISDIIDALKKDFEQFRKGCAATTNNYPEFFFTGGARSGGKTEFQKMLLNSIYGTGNIYKGGYVYPEPDKPDKDLFDAFFHGFTKPYTNAIAKIFKEDKKMEYKETKKEKKEREYNQTTPWNYRPEQIIYNGPATIIKWADGDKTVVKCGAKDEYDRELAFMYSLVKKDHYEDVREGDGEKETNYLRMFKKIYEKTNDPEAAFVTTMSHYILSDCGMNNEHIKRYFAAVKDKMDEEYRTMEKKLSTKHSKED